MNTSKVSFGLTDDRVSHSKNIKTVLSNIRKAKGSIAKSIMLRGPALDGGGDVNTFGPLAFLMVVMLILLVLT